MILYGYCMILYGVYLVLYGFYMIFGGGTSFFGCPVFWNFERSTRNSNVRPEIPTTTEFFPMSRFFEF